MKRIFHRLSVKPNNKVKQKSNLRFNVELLFGFLENLLKLFRKDKLLTDNDFYQWVRNYQINADDEDDSIELSTVS